MQLAGGRCVWLGCRPSAVCPLPVLPDFLRLSCQAKTESCQCVRVPCTNTVCRYETVDGAPLASPVPDDFERQLCLTQNNQVDRQWARERKLLMSGPCCNLAPMCCHRLQAAARDAATGAHASSHLWWRHVAPHHLGALATRELIARRGGSNSELLVPRTAPPEWCSSLVRSDLSE